MKLVAADGERKRALLLHYAGETVYDIYIAEKGDTAATYEATKKVLTDYFMPKVNVQMEIFKFRSCKQESGESLDEYVTKLRTLSKNCEFADTDKEILSQVIQHCRSVRLRRCALREPDKPLKDILDMGRTLEMADEHASSMETSVNQVQYTQSQSKARYKPKHKSSGTSHAKPTHTQAPKPSQSKPSHSQSKPSSFQSTELSCYNCGGSYPHSGQCPAKGKTCNYCKKQDHFRKVCKKLERKNAAYHVTSSQPDEPTYNSDSSDDCYTYSITTHDVQSIDSRLHSVYAQVNGVKCQFLLDCGSTCNIIDEYTYRKLGSPSMAAFAMVTNLRLPLYNLLGQSS